MLLSLLLSHYKRKRNANKGIPLIYLRVYTLKLNIYSGNDVFQLKGSSRFNALKYVNFFHRYKNMTTGDHNGKFLGL